MTEEQRKEVESLYWWHRIELEPGYVTPGECPHGNAQDFESRFGLPKDLTGLTVLDVGGYDGLFSFECEKRGAAEVDMIDRYQNSKNTKHHPNRPFTLAKTILNSNVLYQNHTLEDYNPKYWDTLEDIEICKPVLYDLILYYGVLYHITNPLGAVEKLIKLIKPGSVILVETTIANPELEESLVPVLEYRPGFDGDPTNFFYPNTAWIITAFVANGARGVQVVYNDGIRATYRIKC